MNYFDKFPTVFYNGRVAKNLIAKAQFSDDTRTNKFLYYPYTINNAARSDNLSNQYYDNPGYSWLIWMTNNIIDPYYQMPLSEEQFASYIEDKYQSISKAKRQIKCWRNNWFNDTSQLSLGEFETLGPSEKKYYDPIIDNYLNVVAYKRRVDNTLLSTNVVAEVLTGQIYTVGEEVFTDTGYGTVSVSDDSSTVLTNVIGVISVGQQLTGKTSGSSATITRYTLTSTSGAYQDSSYWIPVTAYDYEYDINEGRKHIKLLDNRYKHQVEVELERVMQL